MAVMADNRISGHAAKPADTLNLFLNVLYRIILRTRIAGKARSHNFDAIKTETQPANPGTAHLA